MRGNKSRSRLNVLFKYIYDHLAVNLSFKMLRFEVYYKNISEEEGVIYKFSCHVPDFP